MLQIITVLFILFITQTNAQLIKEIKTEPNSCGIDCHFNVTNSTLYIQVNETIEYLPLLDQTITQLQIEGNLQRNLFSFQHYKSIQTIIINTNKILKGMFSKMNIQKVVIKENVQEIEELSFYQCKELTEVQIDKNSQIKTIDNFSFQDCVNLKSFHIPKGLNCFSEKIFDGCDSLQKLTIDDKNELYSVKQNVLFSKDGKTLIFYPKGLNHHNKHRASRGPFHLRQKTQSPSHIPISEGRLLLRCL